MDSHTERGWTIRAGIDYPHAWAYDRERSVYIECTIGWPQARGRYRGKIIEWDQVDPLFSVIASMSPLGSFLETLELVKEFR